MADVATGGEPESRLVGVVSVSTAEELLREIWPHGARWQPRPDHWIFRGQWDSRLPLQPSAFREEAFKEFTAADDPATDPAHGQHPNVLKNRERRVLAEFFETADSSGLFVPDRESALGNLRGIEQWPRHYWAMPSFVALARHYGLPTRGLDWTAIAGYAAYFAAVDPKGHATPSGRLSVWALNRTFIEAARTLPHTHVDIFKPARDQNRNMQAQEGLLVVFVDRSEPEATTLEDVLKKLALCDREADGRDTLNPPILYRFDLPRTQAPRLLRLLSYERITAAKMFPGYAGAVAAIKERRLWDERDWRFGG